MGASLVDDIRVIRSSSSKINPVKVMFYRILIIQNRAKT